MHIDHVVVDVLAVVQILPVLAAVGRADRAANFDRAVEVRWLVGARVQHQHAFRRIRARCGCDLGKTQADWQTSPMLAGIVAAVDLAIFTPDKDHVGNERMEQDRPNRQAVVGQLDFLPVLAAIGTAIGPRLCSGVDDLALQRMHSKGADRWHFRQAAWQGLPLVAAVGQPKQPGVYHPAFSGFTSEAKVKMGG